MTDFPRPDPVPRPCPTARRGWASWGPHGATFTVHCDCGFLVEGLTEAEAAKDTLSWHKGEPSALGGDL